METIPALTKDGFLFVTAWEATRAENFHLAFRRRQ
jgi:hypothetical protein